MGNTSIQTQSYRAVDKDAGQSRSYIIPFALLCSLFFLWAVANNLNDILLPQFQQAFTLTNFQAGLIQSAFYFGYFIIPIPAGILMKKLSYKAGIITGLFLYAFGAALFWPAAEIMNYTLFLVGLFIIAAGLGCLETAANPFVTVLGPESSGHFRLNLAQTFNSFGAIIAVVFDNTEKVVGLVDECWRMGLKILPPDINSGLYHFHVNDDGEIVYGIGAIKGVGEGPIEAIIEARNNGGYFRELFDLCARTDIKKLNRRVLEKLIMSGAFDRLGPHRAALMNSLGDALKAADQHAKAEAIGQADMFGVLAEEPEQIEQSYASCQPWPEQVVLDGERETLGLYLTGHPINQYLKEIERYVGGVRLKDMHPTERGKVTTAAGLVIAARVMVTKRGNRIGICTLDDRSGRLEVMLFTDALDKYQQLLEKDRILIVSGQVSFDDFSGGLKMTAREVMDIDEAREKYARGLAISLTDRQIDDQLLNRLRQSLEPHRSGTIPVHLYYQRADARARLRFGATWRVSPSDRLLNDLRGLIGSEQVELEFD